MTLERYTLPTGPTVTCPGCGAPATFDPANRWRPFCSERCQNLDFGAWASERYRVGTAQTSSALECSDSDEPEPP